MITMFIFTVIVWIICMVIGMLQWEPGYEEFRSIYKKIILSCVVIPIFFIIGSMFFIIPVGHAGIKVLFGKIQNQVESGLRIKNPLTEIVKFDIRTMKEEHEAGSASQDLQAVAVDIVINYRIDYENILNLYKKVGKDYSSKIIEPAVQETVKASTAKFKVEEIITKRIDLKESIEELLKEKLSRYWIILETVNLKNVEFSEEFDKVVEEKQIEEQKIKTAEYLKEQAKQESEQKIIRARANAETVLLEAKAESEKQRLLRNTTSKEVIELKWIEKWDGTLPTTILGDKSVPMINLQ